MWIILIEKKIIHIHYNDLYEIYNLGNLFLGHHYYILGLSNLWMGVEKKILKEIMHFHHTTYMATPLHKNPCPGGHEIYNFGRPFLVHHYYIIGLSDLYLSEEKIFKEIMHFQIWLIWPRPSTRTPDQRVMKFTILVDPSLVIITTYLVCLINA